MEALQEGHGEEQQLSKLLLESIQQKSRDHDTAIDVISTQLERLTGVDGVGPAQFLSGSDQLKNQKLIQDNQSLMKEVLLNIDSKIEAVVSRKLMEEFHHGGLVGTGGSDWNTKE